MAATLSRRSTWSWEKYAESVWPERVVLDAAGFQASTALPNGRRSTRTQRAFSVLGAVGYPFLGAKPKVWALEAHGRENQAAWSSLLGSYAGTPELVVTDGGQHLINAVHTAFPRPGDPYPNVRRGEWHLGKNVRSTLPAEIANDPDHPICVALGGAFRSLDGWDRFVETAYAESRRTGGLRGLMRWLQNNEPWVRVHVDTRFGPGPYSVSPVEEILGEVQRRIGDRAGTFANQARMNRLLKLIALDLNGDADELAWAEIIRRHLITNGGRPGDQRQADDPKGYRSLRA